MIMALNSIGIMGGTFNPIHNEHIKLAVDSKDQFELGKVIFVPSGESYFKKRDKVLESDKRLEMARLALDGIDDFEVSDIEVKRPGPSYTCETLKELLEADPNSTYYLIVGADTFMMLGKWKDPEYLFDSCIICVAKRDDIDEDEIALMTRFYEGKYDATIRVIKADAVETSSTDIREKVKEGEDISSYVPAPVEAYIKRNKLYLYD